MELHTYPTQERFEMINSYDCFDISKYQPATIQQPDTKLQPVMIQQPASRISTSQLYLELKQKSTELDQILNNL